jgi:phosphatidylinositol-4-phosphate 3-kinase
MFFSDRAPIVFTKQMLYAMSDGSTSNDAMHRFVDLCCNAFYTLRQNSSLLLLLLSHLCSSNVPNLNHNAVRYVYDRLALSLNYAESITHFTNLIVDSLNSTWIIWNGLIHKLAQTTSLNNSLNLTPNDRTLSFVPKTYTVLTDGQIQSAQVVNFEKRNQPSKYYLYKIKVERSYATYHYRTYNEFYEFDQCLNKQFPLIGLNLKFSRQIEDRVLAQRRVSDINDFLGNLFCSSTDVIEVKKLFYIYSKMKRRIFF